MSLYDRVALFGNIAVSIIVLGGYVVVTIMLFSHSISPESKEIATIMFGGLSTLAGLVVNYWCGSSAGSSQKSATISQLSNKGPP